MKYAILDAQNVVINIAVSNSPLKPNWIPGAGAKIGDIWDGAKFTTPLPEFNDLKNKLFAQADTKKKALLDGGFTLEGVAYDSDINARMAYAELGMRISQDPTYSTPWKASAGQWVTMNATLYQQIASAGEAHIGGVFAWLAGVQSAINSATSIQELMEIAI